MLNRKEWKSLSTGLPVDRPQRPQRPLQLAQRGQDGFDRRLARDNTGQGLPGIPGTDFDLLLGAALSRLAASVAAVSGDVQVMRATVLDCVDDLQSLRRSLANPEAAFSATDACGCNGRGR